MFKVFHNGIDVRSPGVFYKTKAKAVAKAIALAKSYKSDTITVRENGSTVFLFQNGTKVFG